MAYKSTGTLLKIGANTIADITSISDVGGSNPAFDASNLATTAKDYESTGVFDGGEIAVSGFFDPSDTNGQAALWTLLGTGAKSSFSVMWASTGADFSFDALVTEFRIGSEMEDGIGFDCTLRVSGLPTMGISASAGLSGLSLAGTGGTLTPSFGADVRYYAFPGVSADSVTVTATALGHTLKLFVDGTYTQDLTSASASSPIAMVIGTKKLTIIAYQTGKAQQVTEIVVEKAS